jgi:dynactin 1
VPRLLSGTYPAISGTSILTLLFRKLVRRVEDLIQDNSAMKLTLLPQLTALSSAMVKGCDFGIQLAQRIGSYLADVRSQKHDFQLTAVLAHVRETVAETMGQRTTASWEALGQLVASLVKDANAVIEPAMEAENIVKGESAD